MLWRDNVEGPELIDEGSSKVSVGEADDSIPLSLSTVPLSVCSHISIYVWINQCTSVRIVYQMYSLYVFSSIYIHQSSNVGEQLKGLY